MKRLPTLKGIAEFFYVATHWGTISNDFEQYRRQIKDREDWSRVAEEALRKNHEQEKQRIAKEYEEKFKNAEHEMVDAMVPLIQSYGNAVTRLAIHYRLHPLAWELERHDLEPPLRQGIEATMARLLPPPPLPPLPPLLGPLTDDSRVGQFLGGKKRP